MIIRRISLPLLVALALAGCANGDSSGAPAPSAPPAAASSPAASSSPAEESAPTKPPAGGTKTLTGTITAGVEPDCLLLDDHLLLINDA